MSDLIPEATLPVHIHIGPGQCRQLGTIDLSLADDDQQISTAIATMLRSAADRIDCAAAVLADAETMLRAATIPD
ncbi:hypothetical protein PV518_17845 [Streptomyces sp. ND04-05B]|uniref:hypothetical protein n=1 Tax=Streptomyces sp. ND04-05B TaxID=3028693 RepID=UPI0029A9B05C|nr:hypothetical protein [Streptomyces sp. ND04-05B]MDX3064024.1 hypothetical protein [Streptomyces sp. ND04-05B]